MIPGRFASTYSIVARCRATGRIGIGVQSHYFAVGASVPWLASQVGAVVTQSFIDRAQGPAALAHLRAGKQPEAVIGALLAQDPARELRQIAVVDVHGNTAVHTGSGCISRCGHRSGEGYTVQGNMLASDAVLDGMSLAFEQSRAPLPWRLLEALRAAEAKGGDLRGMMSAAIRIDSGAADAEAGPIDIRVDDHEQPLVELRRVLVLADAAGHVARALRLGPSERALLELDEALRLAPAEDEYRFWKAVVLIHLGQWRRAHAILSEEVSEPLRWGRLLAALETAGLVKLEDPALRRLRGARGSDPAGDLSISVE
jgi:uncharacterized Ntn-hydrolase superfamily protein